MLTPPLVDRLEAALRHLEFGAVHLVIHDGKVVRIERIERVRLTESSEATVVISGEPTPSREESSHAQQEG